MPSVHSTSVWSSSFAFQIAFKTRNFYFSNVVVLILKTFNLFLEKNRSFIVKKYELACSLLGVININYIIKSKK